MTRRDELISTAATALAEAVALPIDSDTDADLMSSCALTEEAGRLLDTARVQYAGEIDARSSKDAGLDGLARRYGHANTWSFLAFLTRVSPPEARRRISVGRATHSDRGIVGQSLQPAFPGVAEAMQAGRLGIDSAQIITQVLSAALSAHAPAMQVEVAEQKLVEQAESLCSELIKVQAYAWSQALDPDGAEPRDAKAHRNRSARAGREVDGMIPLTLMAPSADAALVMEIWQNSDRFGTTPRFVDEATLAAGTRWVENDAGELEEEFVDPRTPVQRHYDELFGRIVAGHRESESAASGDVPNAGGGVTSTVTVVISATEFASGIGAGWIDGIDQPIAASTVRQMACGDGFTAVLIDDNGAIAGTGKRRRHFSRAQRRAIAARDGHQCIFPGCSNPTVWADAHHVIEFDKGGPTTVANGVLACPSHHTTIHHGGFALRMINGTPWMLAPPWVDPDQIWRPLGKSRLTITRALEQFSYLPGPEKRLG